MLVGAAAGAAGSTGFVDLVGLVVFLGAGVFVVAACALATAAAIQSAVAFAATAAASSAAIFADCSAATAVALAIESAVAFALAFASNSAADGPHEVIVNNPSKCAPMYAELAEKNNARPCYYSRNFQVVMDFDIDPSKLNIMLLAFWYLLKFAWYVCVVSWLLFFYKLD